MRKYNDNKIKLKEGSNILSKKLLKDNNVIDSIITALEEVEPEFIHYGLSNDDMKKCRKFLI